MIVVKLRDAMEQYRRNAHERMTYKRLSDLTGIAVGTLQQIGSRLDYHPTLGNVEKLCRALGVPLHSMLEMIDDPPKRKARPRKQKKKP